MNWFRKVPVAPRPSEAEPILAGPDDIPLIVPKTDVVRDDPTKPLILCPCHSRVHPGTVELLSELRYRHGWEYRPWYGATGVDRVRSQAASEALTRPQSYWFWCDDDNFLPVKTVLRMWEVMKARDFDVLAAVVPIRRANPRPNFAPLEMEQPVALGEAGGPIEARNVGFAMAFTHRRVFERLIAEEAKRTEEAARHKIAMEVLIDFHKGGMILGDAPEYVNAIEFALANWYQPDLPEVQYNTAYSEQVIPGWPFFRPRVNAETKSHYGEDYSFCERVVAAGMQVWVDTSAIAWHSTEHLLTLGDIIRHFQADEQKRLAAWHDSAELI